MTPLEFVFLLQDCLHEVGDNVVRAVKQYDVPRSQAMRISSFFGDAVKDVLHTVEEHLGFSSEERSLCIDRWNAYLVNELAEKFPEVKARLDAGIPPDVLAEELAANAELRDSSSCN